MEKAMALHSSTLAWKIPWTEEPGMLQSMGMLRIRHDWATSLSIFTFIIEERNGNPLQCSCLENPRDRGAWWAAICGVTQSQTRLKWLSSSGGSDGKESTCQCRRPEFNPWVRKIPWRGERLPTPVFLPEESHGQRSLADYSPWGRRVRYDWATNIS